jgi:hypothetical protein
MTWEGCGRGGVLGGSPISSTRDPRRAPRPNERPVMIFVGLLLLAAIVVSAAGWAAEDRPHMKRIDVSPALPDPLPEREDTPHG